MSKKLVLGYTRAGHAVLLPSRQAFDEEVCVGWSRGDHIDAGRILREHGERETDPEVGPWCLRWAKVHKEIGRAARKSMAVRGAAEIAIRTRGRRVR